MMACVMTEALDYPSIHVPVRVRLILDTFCEQEKPRINITRHTAHCPCPYSSCFLTDDYRLADHSGTSRSQGVGQVVGGGGVGQTVHGPGEQVR